MKKTAALLCGLILSVGGFAQSEENIHLKINISQQESLVQAENNLEKMEGMMTINNQPLSVIHESDIDKLNQAQAGLYNLNVLSNPNLKCVEVSFKTIGNINLILHVTDGGGNIVHSQSFFDYTGDFDSSIQLNENLSGTYFLNLYTNDMNVKKALIMNL